MILEDLVFLKLLKMKKKFKYISYAILSLLLCAVIFAEGYQVGSSKQQTNTEVNALTKELNDARTTIATLKYKLAHTSIQFTQQDALPDGRFFLTTSNRQLK